MQDVAARTNGALKLSPGTLYGSIRRMLEEALIVELSDRQRPDDDDERRRNTGSPRSAGPLRRRKRRGSRPCSARRRRWGLAPGRAVTAPQGSDGQRHNRRARLPTVAAFVPRDFADDYADEMTPLYRDRVRGEGPTSVWLALVADLARTAPRERRRDARAGRATRLADVAADAGPCARRGSDIGPGRRREHRRLQRRARGAPEALALSGCGPTCVEVFEDNTRAGG